MTASANPAARRCPQSINATAPVFLVKVPLQSGKTPVGVTLPDVSSTATSGVPAVHVFGIAVGN